MKIEKKGSKTRTILSTVSIVRNNGHHSRSRRPFYGVDHDEQFHKVIVNWLTRRLHKNKTTCKRIKRKQENKHEVSIDRKERRMDFSQFRRHERETSARTWITNTSWPRTVSSIRTLVSPSWNLLTVHLDTLVPRTLAISCASAGLAFPVKIHSFPVEV